MITPPILRNLFAALLTVILLAACSSHAKKPDHRWISHDTNGNQVSFLREGNTVKITFGDQYSQLHRKYTLVDSIVWPLEKHITFYVVEEDSSNYLFWPVWKINTERIISSVEYLRQRAYKIQYNPASMDTFREQSKLNTSAFANVASRMPEQDIFVPYDIYKAFEVQKPMDFSTRDKFEDGLQDMTDYRSTHLPPREQFTRGETYFYFDYFTAKNYNPYKSLQNLRAARSVFLDDAETVKKEIGLRQELMRTK